MWYFMIKIKVADSKYGALLLEDSSFSLGFVEAEGFQVCFFQN